MKSMFHSVVLLVKEQVPQMTIVTYTEDKIVYSKPYPKC